MQGIGYQEARRKRFAEGFTGSNLEAKGNEEFLLYFGRAHINDFETGVQARGLLKIGRGKFKTALQRGRNQPGVDFRIYAEILVATNNDTHKIENVAKDILSHKNVPGAQGQKELYDIKDDELFDTVNDVAEVSIDCHGVEVLGVNFYTNNEVSQTLEFVQNNKRKVMTQFNTLFTEI
jgi:hypothetical protein